MIRARHGWPILATIFVMGIVATWAAYGENTTTQSGAAPASKAVSGDLAASIKRGAYLAKMADCAGCHTATPGADAKGNPINPPAFAGSLPMNSPFGTIYSSNITPDPRYGIGAYNYEQFADVLRKGVARDGSHLYPAMPFPSFSKINESDMRDLYAYFMHGVTPVATPAHETRLPFPFNQRWALGIWSWMFSPNSPYQADAKHDVHWNRGAYLVQSLGHCGACHTPRGPAYEELGYTGSSPLYLSGGTNDHWFAPDLRSTSPSGLGRIPAADVAAFLKHGHGGSLITFGSMVQVVEDSTQYVEEQDLDDIATYLKSLPAGESAGHYAPNSLNAAQSVDAVRTGHVDRPGAGLYLSSCARCHQANGQGVAGKYPALAGNPVVLGSDTQSLIRLLIEGGRSPETESGPLPRKMPAFSDQFTDKEMARVLTFVRTTWGNSAAPVTDRDIDRVRSALHH